MAILKLPLSSEFPKFKFNTELDEETFIFNFRLNERLDRWVMSISDAAETPLVMGIPVLLGVPFYEQFKNPGLPKGRLFAINPESPTTEAGSEDLGKSVLVFYSEEGDLEERIAEQYSGDRLTEILDNLD
jgi:hypothetical protein